VCLVPSKIPNFLWGWVRTFWGFFLPFEAKIQNGEWILFAKNFIWCLVLFCKIMGQNPKFFGCLVPPFHLKNFGFWSIIL
jgi:hypothetical protein